MQRMVIDNQQQPQGMEIDTLCPMCGRLNEDGAHLFLKCKFSKSLWREMQLNEEREHLLACDGPKEMISNILKLPEEKKLKCVMMLRAWWMLEMRTLVSLHGILAMWQGG